MVAVEVEHERDRTEGERDKAELSVARTSEREARLRMRVERTNEAAQLTPRFVYILGKAAGQREKRARRGGHGTGS